MYWINCFYRNKIFAKFLLAFFTFNLITVIVLISIVMSRVVKYKILNHIILLSAWTKSIIAFVHGENITLVIACLLYLVIFVSKIWHWLYSKFMTVASNR